jgi:release factor glutamine methyltransferase
VPRPETERLVDEVLAWVGGRSGLEVLDVGTGSGAIALSLAGEGSFGRVVATDLSAGALEVAGENRAALGLQGEVELRQGGLFEPVAGERFDIVVSNPPYVAEKDGATLAAEVRDWEPAEALFAGADGLEVIRALVARVPPHLRPGGLLALEIGCDQGPAVAALIAAEPAFTAVRVRPDLGGRDRFVLAERSRD